jgi:hypothetical protein|mmetsp:Transcript_20633/g.35487  ORF Transcript_20633/g.35487 Transcript_20633/m.35487 type:complete len:158 (-) Transcript_20633:1403-1876(-)
MTHARVVPNDDANPNCVTTTRCIKQFSVPARYFSEAGLSCGTSVQHDNACLSIKMEQRDGGQHVGMQSSDKVVWVFNVRFTAVKLGVRRTCAELACMVYLPCTMDVQSGYLQIQCIYVLHALHCTMRLPIVFFCTTQMLRWRTLKGHSKTNKQTCCT